MNIYYNVKQMFYSIINNCKFQYYNTFCKTGFSNKTMIYPDGLTTVLPKSIYKNDEIYDQYMIDNNLICVICFNELITKKDPIFNKSKSKSKSKSIKNLFNCDWLNGTNNTNNNTNTNTNITNNNHKRPSISCVELPCKHTFHKSCIQEWFNYNKNCPTCKMEC